MTNPTQHFEHPIKVKNFGNDESFRDFSELQQSLSEHYKGKHVSIVFPMKPSGLMKTVFVSISEDGQVRKSYGSEALIDFDSLQQTLSV